MIQTLPDPSLLPQWVKETLSKQLRVQFPAESGQRIGEALEQAARLMKPAYCLATLLATATVLLRKESSPPDRHC